MEGQTPEGAGRLAEPLPYWNEKALKFCKPDTLSLSNGDGVKYVWMRGAEGPQEYIEIVWWV